MHIPMAFSKLIFRLQPTNAGINKAKLHSQSIKTRLKNSFNMNSQVFIGSTARQTAIKGYSDVDLLVVIPRDYLMWGDDWIGSDTFLRNIRNDLNERFHSTDVRRDKQAVVIGFGGGSESVDVVPGVFHSFKTTHKVPIFLIPDGEGGWIETAPAAHNNYIKAEIVRSVGKLGRTIQLMKHWRNCRSPSIPLSSIHLELLLATSGICVGAKGYARCLFEVFQLLDNRKCRGLHDPTGLAGVLYAVRTEADTERLTDAIAHALDHSLRALIAEGDKDWREAVRQWNIVFNGEFS